MTRFLLAVVVTLSASAAQAFVTIPQMPPLWPHAASTAPVPVITPPHPDSAQNGPAQR